MASPLLLPAPAVVISDRGAGSGPCREGGREGWGLFKGGCREAPSVPRVGGLDSWCQEGCGCGPQRARQGAGGATPVEIPSSAQRSVEEQSQDSHPGAPEKPKRLSRDLHWRFRTPFVRYEPRDWLSKTHRSEILLVSKALLGVNLADKLPL